jgi:cysteinyl-tRNA synthetase
MIKFYNSMSREVEEFIPRDPAKIQIYVCGPTVYDTPHIGNARPGVVFDVMRRVLIQQYGDSSIQYVSNLTDVDDKIIDAARSRNIDIHTLTARTIDEYRNAMSNLGVMLPDIQPKATSYVHDMKDMILRLINKGHAYVVDREVFFHVPSNPHRGIAHHADDALQPGGHRVEQNPKKRDPRDFILWKSAGDNMPAWYSPWGDGRPGWHIECSAMIEKTMGTTIDIHAGGQDLRFPHHEAEMAQSQCAHDGAPLANYWLHNGMLTVDGQKMSKSLGNVITVDDLLRYYPGESIRYLMLLTHYRSPMNYTRAGLAKAHRGLSSLYSTLYEYQDVEAVRTAEISDRFLSKLAHDLNTPGAIADLHTMAGYLRNRDDKPYYKALLLNSARVLGILKLDSTAWMTLGIDKRVVEVLITQRDQARTQRDWAEADRIRDQLNHMGVTLADGQGGTSWRKT